MNTQRRWSAFPIVVALTLNFGPLQRVIDNPVHNNSYKLFFVLIVCFVATIIKIHDRSHMGAVLLATSLVSDLQIIASPLLWVRASQATGNVTSTMMASVVSLSLGAMLACLTDVIVLISKTVHLRR